MSKSMPTLRDELRAADPANAPSMTTAERQRIRAGLLGAAVEMREPAPATGGLRPAWAVLIAGLLILGAGGLWFARPPSRPTAAPASIITEIAPIAEALAPRHPLVPSAELLRPRTSLRSTARTALPARTIHFTAPRGTRLVWVVPTGQPGDG